MPTPPVNNPPSRTSTPSPSRGKLSTQRLLPSRLGVAAAPTVATAFDIDLSGLPHVASPLGTSAGSQKGESSSSTFGSSLAASSTLSQFISTAKHSHASPSRPRRKSNKDRPSSPASTTTTLSTPPDSSPHAHAHASSASPESARAPKRQRHPSIVHRTSGRGGMAFHPPAARSLAEPNMLDVLQTQPRPQGSGRVDTEAEASGIGQTPGRSASSDIPLTSSTAVDGLPDGWGDEHPAGKVRQWHGSLPALDSNYLLKLLENGDGYGDGEQELNEVDGSKAEKPVSQSKVTSPPEAAAGSSHSNPESQAATHEHNEEPALNEVDSSPSVTPCPVNPGPLLAFSPPFKSPSPYRKKAYVVPYTPRVGVSTHPLPAPATSAEGGDPAPPTAEEDFTLSIYLSLPRPSPLPQLSAYRLELCLAWAQLQPNAIWLYLPGGKYVPEWDIKLVGGGEAGRERVVDLREVMRGAVGRMPFVWRLAGCI